MLAPAAAFAGIIAADDFDGYASGSIGGQGKAVYGWWASNWGAGAASSLAANVTNTSISFTPSGGSTLGGSNSLSIAGSGTGILASRRLYARQTNTFYAGMLVKWEGPALNTGNSLALYLTDSETNVTGGFNFGLYGIWSTYGTSVRVGTNTPVAGAYLALPLQFATYYMVVKVEKNGAGNYNKITGWVNPNSSSESTNPTGDIQLLADSGVSNVTTLIFWAGGFNSTAPNGPDYTLSDSLALATTFADLMGPPGDPPLDPNIPLNVFSVETRADGLGVVVPAKTLAGGTQLTNYAIARNGDGVFLSNTPAIWALTNVTGNVIAGDLTASPDGKSAIFKADGSGSVRIQVLSSGPISNSVPSGDITVTNALNVRPFIWVRSHERRSILDKIAHNSWALSMSNSLASRAAGPLAGYLANRDAWLRDLPVLWASSPPLFKTEPTYSVRTAAETNFNDALDCAILYYLTQNTNYANFAADMLHNTVKTLAPVSPSASAGNGGLIFQDDWNRECRVLATQLPIIYDFVYPFIKSNQVYDVQTASLVNFNFANAQTVFTNYYVLARDHGDGNDNWCSLEATAMLNNLLALDSSNARSNFLKVYLTTGATQQSSLQEDYNRDYTNSGAIWHESLQYSSAVTTIRANNMVLLERYDPTLNLLNVYSNYLNALPRYAQLCYPSKTDQILFGDGHRGDVVTQPYTIYEQIYALSQARGYSNWAAMFGGLLKGGINAGDYSRSTLSDYDTLGQHNEPLQLLWSYPIIAESPVYISYPRSDALPWAGISLQRNPSTAGGTYGLMCFVGGAAFTHGHASGMNMELYGCGYVLGSKSGRDAYGTALHEDYYRLFSAHNTIVVNAGSQGSGAWENIAINTVQNVAMEPQLFADAVSSNFSFTCSSFADNMGALAEATQQRTMAIIRTSPTNGFYVDIFRSVSTVTNRVATTLNGNVTNQFHDYIYRNVGSSGAMTLKTNGVSLGLFSQPSRFQNNVGDNYQQPGWLYFTNQGVSYPQSQLTQVHFVANPGDGINRDTEMWIAAVTNREYAKVDSPGFSEWVDTTALGPTVVIRQIGEAWSKPFAVVYEPYFASAGYTVTNVTALWRTNVVVGVKVQSRVSGKSMVHYVLSNTNATDTYQDSSIGLSFTGRFAVISDDGSGAVSLYLGQGKALSYRGNSVAVVGNTNSQAEVQFNPGQAPIITANAPVNVISAAAPVFTGISRQTSGVVSFTVTGAMGVPYWLWSRTNLNTGAWTVLNSGTVTNSPFVMTDSSAVSNSTCYYLLSTP